MYFTFQSHADLMTFLNGMSIHRFPAKDHAMLRNPNSDVHVIIRNLQRVCPVASIFVLGDMAKSREIVVAMSLEGARCRELDSYVGVAYERDGSLRAMSKTLIRRPVTKGRRKAKRGAEKIYEWTAGKLKPVSHVAQAAVNFVEDDDWQPYMVSF
ncbi:MAG: hypothetical protein J5I93_23405 [Pirellulaceae bacterium]|nr:hypothetical protein [Pirellulaceae bacterium]